MSSPTRVSIQLPAAEFVGVARVVAAGVATRLALRYEAVDDLQIAIETVLRSAFRPDDLATIDITTDPRSLSVAIGPVGPGILHRRLRGYEAPGGIELVNVLERLVDHVTIEGEKPPAILLRVDLADVLAV